MAMPTSQQNNHAELLKKKVFLAKELGRIDSELHEVERQLTLSGGFNRVNPPTISHVTAKPEDGAMTDHFFGSLMTDKNEFDQMPHNTAVLLLPGDKVFPVKKDDSSVAVYIKPEVTWTKHTLLRTSACTSMKIPHIVTDDKGTTTGITNDKTQMWMLPYNVAGYLGVLVYPLDNSRIVRLP